MKSSKEYYQVIKVKDNIYHIGSDEGVFVDLFVGQNQALLWDSGYGFGDLRSVINSLIKDKPLIVVNSHGHLDHTCGNFQFIDCPIYLNEKDIISYEMFNTIKARKESVERAKHTPLEDTFINTLPIDFDEAIYINAPLPKTLPIQENHYFDLGGITLVIKEVPGHTAGSIGLLYKEEGWFYAGDAMNPFVWLFLPDALPLSTYKDTLVKAKEWNCTKLCISHHTEALPYEILNDFIDCANELNYQDGIPFTNSLFPEYKAKICVIKKDKLKYMGQAECPAIVIGEEQL